MSEARGGARHLSGDTGCWELKPDCLSDVRLGCDAPGGGESVDKLEAAAALGMKVDRGSQYWGAGAIVCDADPEPLAVVVDAQRNGCAAVLDPVGDELADREERGAPWLRSVGACWCGFLARVEVREQLAR